MNTIHEVNELGSKFYDKISESAANFIKIILDIVHCAIKPMLDGILTTMFMNYRRYITAIFWKRHTTICIVGSTFTPGLNPQS